VVAFWYLHLHVRRVAKNGRDKNEIEKVPGARFIYVDSTTNVALYRLDSADLDRFGYFLRMDVLDP
jgi:hypothetical protein